MDDRPYTVGGLIDCLQKLDPTMKVGRCRFMPPNYQKVAFDNLIDVEVPGEESETHFPGCVNLVFDFSATTEVKV